MLNNCVINGVCRMVDDGALPNTKTFTALIGSFGKMGSVATALEVRPPPACHLHLILCFEAGAVGDRQPASQAPSTGVGAQWIS